MYDSASSWWTQTCNSNLQTEVTRAVAAAAGRYMHVLWPEVAHEPGLELTKKILSGPLGKGWASRVFFSDDGSTAIEVGLKMAFRRYQVEHGLLEVEEGRAPRLEVRQKGGWVGVGGWAAVI
jgi:dethiobiotin synthetase/adenosylmethionine--8-amino-7-oxononanoate aminotransferase